MDKEHYQVILKTVTKGKLKIYNVPHRLYSRVIEPDGEREYFDGNVMLKLRGIYQKMRKDGLLEYDYNDEI